jgi:hypothetical protein
MAIRFVTVGLLAETIALAKSKKTGDPCQFLLALRLGVTKLNLL